MHLTALALGFGSLFVAALAKSTPESLLKVFPTIAEDEEEAKPSSKADDLYHRAKIAIQKEKEAEEENPLGM